MTVDNSYKDERSDDSIEYLESKIVNDGRGSGEEPQEPRSKSFKPSSSDMVFYYEKLLPFRYVFQWLSHSPKVTKDFSMREFAYEYRSGAYQRYNSYSSLEEFKSAVISANPTRFEIGAIYSVNPKERKNVPKLVMKPLRKELVFDIDLTDYDDIRTCCSDKDICKKCWKFIQVASKIIDRALREDFGFKHIVWVFSGRRGAHCWVSDARALQLDEIARKSIVDYLDVLGSKLATNGSKKILNLKKPFHPHIERSFDILKREFIDIILQDQDPWLTESSTSSESRAWRSVKELISFIPDQTLQTKLMDKWSLQQSLSSSKAKWEDIQELASKTLKNQAQVNQLNEAKKEIIISYLYPRLDVEVSRQLIHLLKSPFCIHPSTGNVCVPFDIYSNISGNELDDGYGFNPITSPNLHVLQNEMEDWEQKASLPNDELRSSENKNDLKRGGRIPDYERTSLKPYVEYFAKFVNELIKDELKGTSAKRENDDKLDF